MQILPINKYYQSISKFQTNNHKFFYSVLICLLGYLFIGLFSPPQAQAESGISLQVSPTFITVEAIPPSNPKLPITIENKGDNPENIQIQLLPFRPSQKEEGQIEYLNNNSIPRGYKNIFGKIHLTDNGIITKNFQLGPKQKKDLQLQFFILKEEPTADYYFSVIFSTNTPRPTPQNINIAETAPNTPGNNDSLAYSTLNAGIATNVLLSIGSKDHPQGEISEFSSPQFLQSGPVPFTVRIKNSGPHVFSAFGRIFIKNIFGQTIGRIDLEPTNILSGTSRFARRSSVRSEGGLAQGSASQDETTIIWPEKFLLGPYTATLNLALSEKGPVYNKSIMFFALPIQLTIGMSIALTIIITITLRIRYRLKNDK